MPELFGEEIDAEDGECSEYRREELQSRDAIPQQKKRECLQIDEKSFATVVVGIEPLVVAGFIGADRVDAIHRLVRIEPCGNVFDIPKAQEKRRREEHDQNGCRNEFLIRKKMPEEMSPHNLTV